LYGFTLNVQSIQPVGEGSLRRAAALLEAKLAAEGLFEPERKRPLPYPPRRIGLVTSSESAAYVDFIKVLNARWGGVEVSLADVQVQGEAAPTQILAALDYFNSHAEPPEVLIITRGGGSAEDLAAFNTEQVTRAVAGSRIPTLVAIGHEVDISLAEMAADKRASTPSNAAELLVPDKKHLLAQLPATARQMGNYLSQIVEVRRRDTSDKRQLLTDVIARMLEDNTRHLHLKSQLLKVLDPASALKRGYAVLRSDGQIIKSVKSLKVGQAVDLTVQDGSAAATINKISLK
jgi:exodeoxyribonuclease VII large subunit